jgi:hypothetical protein
MSREEIQAWLKDGTRPKARRRRRRRRRSERPGPKRHNLASKNGRL